MFKKFLDWLHGIPPEKVAIVTALITLLGTFFLNQVVLPLLKELFRKLKKPLFPYVSGLWIIEWLWSLPRYLCAVKTEVNTLSNPWLSTTQGLTEIYVPVHAADNLTAGSSSEMGRVELNNLFASHRALVLIGAPGCGKTTGMKSIALQCLLGRHDPPSFRKRAQGAPFMIPVFLRLRHFAEKNIPFDEFLLDHFAGREFPGAGRMIGNLRRNGRLVFLLDGLDEVEETQLPKTIENLSELLRSERLQEDQPDDVVGHKKKSVVRQRCPVLITTRPNVYHGQFGRPIEIADFDASDIKKFIANFRFPPPKSRERLYAAIMQRPALQQICRNPLMLTIVTSLYAETEYQLPDSREEFYRQCIEALLTKLDSHKNLEKRNHIQAGRKEAFLQEFAYSVLQSAQLEWRDTELTDEIERFLKSRGYSTTDADRFRFELLMSGLLMRLPTGENQFSHKTFAESLAAAYLHTRPDVLRDNLRTAPATWLEVASLYVADPRTPEQRLTQIIEVSAECNDLNSLIILAGEAHSCPDRIKAEISQKLANTRETWASLEDRAVIALCSLGDYGRSGIEALLNHSDEIVRARAVRALGASAEHWTSGVLAKALEDPQNAAFAATALVGMGETAIPILSELLLSSAQTISLHCKIIDILRKIGGPSALSVCIAALSLQNPAVQASAALACGILLADPVLREKFEIEDAESATANLPSPDRYLVEWVAPWLPRERDAHEWIYAAIVWILCSEAAIRDVSAEDLAAVAPRLLLPTLLHSYYKQRSLLGSDPPFWKVWKAMCDKKQAIRPSMCLPESEVPAQSLIERRSLWKDVRFPSKSDIQLKGVSVRLVFFAFWIIGSGVVLVRFMFRVPQPTGASIRTISETILWFNHYTAPALWMVAIALVVLNEFKHRDPNREPAVFVASSVVLSVITMIMAAFFVGGFWWLCLFSPCVLLPFLRGDALVFYRRSNPFARLVEVIENIRLAREKST